MDSLIIALKAVLPLTLIMALGATARHSKAVSEKSFKEFNWVVFHYCLPLSLFLNIVDADLSQISDPGILAYAIGGMCFLIAVSMLLLSRSKLKNVQKGVLVQGIFRTNFAILGLPIVESIYGTGNTAMTSLMIAFVVPFFNIAAILILQKYSGQQGDMKAAVRKIVRNPLIIGVLCGLAWKLLSIPFPAFAHDMISYFTKITSPLSLFVLGGVVNRRSLQANSRLLVFYTIAKLILAPAVLLAIAVMIGYRDVALVSLLVLFAGPAAISSFPMTESMGLDGELAAQCILVSTVCVTLTLFLFISGMDMIGLI